MNKKLICAILCMITMFIFTACGDAENHKEEADQVGKETTTWNGGDSLITGKTKQLTEPPAAWKISEETKLKSEKIEYDPKTDGDWRTAGEARCEAENGNLYQLIYKMDPPGALGAYLYCYDTKNHSYRILCNRPECLHDSEACDAFLAEETFGLEYYNGKIYTVLIERDDDVRDETETFSSITYANLYAIDPDGTGRVKVQSLKVIERKNADCNISSITIGFMIHHGYVYYIHNLGEETEKEDYYRNGKNCIFRVPLGGSEAEAECIYVLPKIQDAENVFDQDYVILKPFGRYIYFAESKFEPGESEGHLTFSLNRIDTENQQVERIRLEKVPNPEDFYVTEEGIYYNSNDMGYSDGKIRLYHPEDGTEEIVADYGALSEARPISCSYDGTCWYAQFDKEQEEFVTDFIVLDSDFKKIGELDFGVHLLMSTSARYQMVLFTEDDKLYGWLDKADIAKGDLTVHRAEQTE